MSPSDPLEERLKEYIKEVDRLRRQNKELSGKKDIPPKKRYTIDRQTATRITEDIGHPTAIANGLMYVMGKVMSGVSRDARYYWHWVTDDELIYGWTLSLLILLCGAGIKFVRKYGAN